MTTPPTLAQQLDTLLQKWAETPAANAPASDWLAALRASLLQAAHDEEEVARWIQRQLGQLEQWRSWLEGVRNALPDLAAVRRRHLRRQPDWWEGQRQELAALFTHDPQRGSRRWFRLFAEALTDGQLDIGRRLTRERFPFPASLSAVVLSYLVRLEDLEAGRYERALEMLLDLVEHRLAEPPPRETEETPRVSETLGVLPTSPEPASSPETRALLYIFIGRIYLNQREDVAAAQQAFEHAGRLAPTFGPAQAALGHFFRHQNQERKAAAHFNHAIELSPGEPDGYVGMALLAEGQQWWEEAAGWYTRASSAVADEAEPAVYLARLQAPVSGNLYVHLARQLYQQRAYQAALAALEQATNLGARDGTDYPNRIIQELKGQTLRALGQRQAAGEAFYEAGRRYYWLSQYESAIRCLRYARRLQPERANTYWYLADAWRILSYRSEPPYVHVAQARRGCVIWEAGAQRHAIDGDSAWAYMVRARLADRLARAPDEVAHQQWWLAAALGERALLWEASSSRWAALASFYRFLSLEANALEAARQALALDPDERTALEELAAITVNQGYFQEALPVLERLIEESSGNDRRLYLSWKAIAVYFLEAWPEAIQLIEEATQPDTADIWDRTVRANIYRLGGRTAAAQADYTWVWQQRANPLYAQAQLELGWAAYQLGHFPAAQTFLQPQLHNRDQAFDAALYLSLCYLTQGDITAADAMARQALQTSLWFRQVEDARILWEEFGRRADLTPEQNGALQQYLAWLAQRRRELQPVTPQEELAQAQSEEDQVGTPVWQAVRAAAGRLYLSQDNWLAAADMYQQLAVPEANFPEARLGLEKVAAGLQSAVQQALQAEQSTQVLSLLNRAAALPLLPTSDRQAGDFSVWRGLAQLMEGGVAEGMEAFNTALAHYQTAGLDAGSTLGEWCAAHLSTPQQYWHVAHSFESQEGATWTAARRALSRYLDDAFYLSAGVPDDLATPVTPIAVHVSPGLLPADTGPDWALFQHHLPEMRERIWQRLGVRLPGVRLREGDDDFEAGVYVILLDDVPQAVGYLHPEHSFVLHAPQEVAAQLQVDEADIQVAPIPGRPSSTGCWLPDHHRPAAEAAGLTLWPDPWQYLAHHLEKVLEGQLALFLHVQAVEDLLQAWPDSPADHALIASLLPDAAARLRLGRILRALVSEGVSIGNWWAILRQLQTIALPADDVADALPAVRLALRADLPGNQPGDSPALLPLELETAIARWITRQGAQQYLAIPPGPAQAILDEVSAWANHHAPIQVVEVRHTANRLFVQRLLSVTYPEWRFIATGERLTAGREGEHDA